MRISDWSSDVCSSDLLMGHCGDQMDRIREMFANQALRIEIVHRDRQIPVGGKTAGGLGQPRRALEVNRLRHDDDPVPWELLDDALPELLVNRVKIRSEERRVGNDVSVRVDLGGRRIIKQKKQSNSKAVRRQQQKQRQSL